MTMLCIGNFYCKKMQFRRESRTPRSLVVLRMSMRKTLNISGSWLNVTSPFVLCIHVGIYACVRVCTNVSYALDYTEKFRTKQNIFHALNLFYILHLYMYVDTARHGRAENTSSSGSPWEYIYFHTICIRAAKCLTIL